MDYFYVNIYLINTLDREFVSLTFIENKVARQMGLKTDNSHVL